MNPDEWPHQFTKNGKETVLDSGEIAIPYICIHCHVGYIRGLHPIPASFCPARNTRREMKRIKS